MALVRVLAAPLCAALVAVAVLASDEASAQAPTAAATIPPTKCSGAPNSAYFHACLAVTNHAKSGSWRAQHPTVAQPKPSNQQGPGFGQLPHQIPSNVLPK